MTDSTDATRPLAPPAALFNESDHCTLPGWATYHKRRTGWLCRLLGHSTAAPQPSNDHCPAAYTRCGRCKAWLRWFHVGTHRYGGLRAFTEAEDYPWSTESDDQ